MLTSEFHLDIDRFPFMEPDLIVESSGNHEVKSNGKLTFSVDGSISQAEEFDRLLPNGHFHFSYFNPRHQVQRIVRRGRERVVAARLEKISLYLMLRNYFYADHRRPPHFLDSWSVDRFSPRDLEQVVGWFQGVHPLSYWDQKAHNIGFRPTSGGLNLETRGLGSDIPLAKRIMTVLQETMRSESPGSSAEGSDWLFHEFRDPFRGDARDYTLERALLNRGNLSDEDAELARKLQFEIYKPSMQDYMVFGKNESYNTVDASEMSTEFVRTNFESNIAVALLPWEGQSYLSAEEKRVVAQRRTEFLDGIHQVIARVRADPRYRFIRDRPNFLHLCEFLRRSTHESRPQFEGIGKNEAALQRDLLEELVYEVRALSAKFVRESGVFGAVARSLWGGSPRPGSLCPALLDK